MSDDTVAAVARAAAKARFNDSDPRHAAEFVEHLAAEGYTITRSDSAGTVSAALERLTTFLYEGIGWQEDGPVCMTVEDRDHLDTLIDEARAALQASASTDPEEKP
jgi:hypothetical protein